MAFSLVVERICATRPGNKRIPLRPDCGPNITRLLTQFGSPENPPCVAGVEMLFRRMKENHHALAGMPWPAAIVARRAGGWRTVLADRFADRVAAHLCRLHDADSQGIEPGGRRLAHLL